MSRDLLQRIGQALYGERWQSALAIDLGVSDRMVRKWVSGENEPRPGVLRDLRRLVLERRGRLDALVHEIDEEL